MFWSSGFSKDLGIGKGLKIRFIFGVVVREDELGFLFIFRVSGIMV